MSEPNAVRNQVPMSESVVTESVVTESVVTESVVNTANPAPPLWVKSGHRRTTGSCPLYPRKRTLELRRGMSALCGGFNGSTQHLLILLEEEETFEFCGASAGALRAISRTIVSCI